MKKLIIDSDAIMKYEQRGKTNHFYVWLTWQFNGAIFLDAGTRTAASARDFSYNPKNLVLTYDVTDEGYLQGRVQFFDLTNVIFKQLDVNLIEPTWLSKVDVILLDISHNGDDEQLFLDRIEPHFKGILVMDDINCTERYPELFDVFNSLDREKHLLTFPIGASRGTGIVPYGDWTVEVV